MITLTILLVFLVALCSLLMWYTIYAARRFKQVTEDLSRLEVIGNEFAEHLQMVYDMDKFFGDDILENLLKHSKAVADEFRLAWENYSLEENPTGDLNEDNDPDDDSSA